MKLSQSLRGMTTLTFRTVLPLNAIVIQDDAHYFLNDLNDMHIFMTFVRLNGFTVKMGRVIDGFVRHVFTHHGGAEIVAIVNPGSGVPNRVVMCHARELN